ncbi:MAG: STAS domain-containing protein [Candidatus Promineifilaceae bacterium]|nr:STAS domain-containing protein [Candidatus Promineifilaceae bacterium]
MEFYHSQVGTITIVALKGDLDGQTAAAVQDELLPLIDPECKIILDMGGVPYISSVGLRALLLLYRKSTAVGGHIVLCCLSEMLRDTMLITGFLEFFESYEVTEDALQALRSA